ncbi:T9SS type A sorting domain-containing protein, partial [bacterium]|nr:T9SS type A sorting domain-containing protein [bacterium]
WNTISTNLQPNDNENIEGLVDSIVTTGAMIMMKNTNGDFYRPAYDFNNIQAWNSWDGFQMLMAEAATLTIAGESVLKEDPIDLTSGWQLVSYYPRYEIEATEALATIYDHLIIAKDGYGNFCLPEWDDFSNMGNLCEGQGYFIKVDADCRLVYVPEEEEERSSASVIRSKSVYDEPGQLPVHAVTGENMSLLVTTDASLEGDVGVYAGGELVGSGVIQDGVCGIAVWGDDQSTEKIDGAISGDALEVKLLTDSGLQNASYTVLSGKLTYKTDGLTIIRLNSASELPLEFGIVSAYPNPFNSQMRVSYNLLETGVVDLAAYDVSGRRVAELTSGRQVSGVHTVMFDGKDMPSGVYMLRLQAGGQSSMMKVMLVK